MCVCLLPIFIFYFCTAFLRQARRRRGGENTITTTITKNKKNKKKSKIRSYQNPTEETIESRDLSIESKRESERKKTKRQPQRSVASDAP